MSKSTYFVQECPTCGRSLHVRVEYLGRHLVCQHCGGHLVASDSEGASCEVNHPQQGLLRRVDQLIESAQFRRVSPG